MSAMFIVNYVDIEENPPVTHHTVYCDYEFHRALIDFLHAIDVSEDATLEWSS